MKIRHLFFLITAIALASCATPKIAYFQDIQPGVGDSIATPVEIRVRPDDKISIIVNSKDPLLTNLFNLPYLSRQLGSTSSTSSNPNQGVSGYTVNKEGNIDFPVMGYIHVVGMTRSEIAQYIKDELIRQSLVKDPVVTVEFMNLTFSVLGEVTNPGRFNIDKDCLTLPEAISMAGDLTIFGKRDNVKVLRNEDGKLMTYKIDLAAGSDLYASPAYYLQQNDIIYVEPNGVRARQSTVNGNNVRSVSFWMSLASLLTSIVVLIVK